MVNLFIYAKDFSASTNKEPYYHSNGLETLKQFQNDVEKIKKELANSGEGQTESKTIYLHWGSSCEEVDEETTKTMYLQQIGKHGGTNPAHIIYWIKQNHDICSENNKIRLIYIITDGLISSSSADRCFELNENINYESVVFHAFHEQKSSVDLSVAASFFKSRCQVYCNNQLHDSINISEEFDYSKINIDNFDSEKENMKSYIKLKFLRNIKNNSLSLKEVEKLKKLRTRLFDELSSKTPETKINLETKDRSVFIHEFARTDWYKDLKSVHDTKVDIEKAISTLINYIITERKSYSFDALKFDTKFNKPVEEEQVVDINFTDEQEIAFPDIILDDEKGVPVIILTKLDLMDKIIFHGQNFEANMQPGSFSKFKSTMECPLYLAKDKDISDTIGYFYTFNVYKQFLENNTKNEPRTRKPFHGGLVLMDTDQFDKYNDYILSATYFDSKKVNFNIGLFYYVLWKNCEKKEWMDRNVVERFKKYTMRRISETVCKIGLSSLPLDPQEQTSLLTALWYCVELSSHIFKDDPVNYNHERLRMFYGVAHCMIEILKYFDYDLDLEFIEKRRELISHVMILKKIQKQEEKVYYLLEKIFKTVDGLLVSEIENPLNLYKLNYLKLNHKNMLNDDVMNETIHLNDYVHLMHFVGDMDPSKTTKLIVEICEKTFRPYFAIDKNNSFYTELVNNTRKIVINNDDDKEKINISLEPINSLEFEKIVSLYNLFIRCVEDTEKYPTMPEYIEYIIKKKKYFGELVNIFPSNVDFLIRGVYGRYQKIMDEVEVQKFITVCKTNVSRIQRIQAEQNVKFESQDEIDKFISREETKVNLKKKT